MADVVPSAAGLNVGLSPAGALGLPSLSGRDVGIAADIGSVRDHTAIAVATLDDPDRLPVIMLERASLGVDFDALAGVLAELAVGLADEGAASVTLVVDATGMGGPFAARLRKALDAAGLESYAVLVPVVFQDGMSEGYLTGGRRSVPKVNAIEALMTALERNTLTLPDLPMTPQAAAELQAFHADETATGRLRYGNRTAGEDGQAHDDLVIALALLAWLHGSRLRNRASAHGPPDHARISRRDSKPAPVRIDLTPGPATADSALAFSAMGASPGPLPGDDDYAGSVHADGSRPNASVGSPASQASAVSSAAGGAPPGRGSLPPELRGRVGMGGSLSGSFSGLTSGGPSRPAPLSAGGHYRSGGGSEGGPSGRRPAWLDTPGP